MRQATTSRHSHAESPEALVGLGAAATLAGALLLLFGAWGLQRRSRIADGTVLPEGGSGPCTIEGPVVAAGDTLEGPLSQAPCVRWSYSVEKPRRGRTGRRNIEWQTIARDADAVPFLVEGPGAVVLVRPDGAAWDLHADASGRTGTFTDPTPELEAFLDRIGVAVTPEPGGFNRKLRCRVSELAPGDTVCVSGTARPPEPGEVDGDVAALVVDGEGPDGLVIGDGTTAELGSRLLWKNVGWIGLGAILAVGGFLMLAAGLAGQG